MLSVIRAFASEPGGGNPSRSDTMTEVETAEPLFFPNRLDVHAPPHSSDRDQGVVDTASGRWSSDTRRDVRYMYSLHLGLKSTEMKGERSVQEADGISLQKKRWYFAGKSGDVTGRNKDMVL